MSVPTPPQDTTSQQPSPQVLAVSFSNTSSIISTPIDSSDTSSFNSPRSDSNGLLTPPNLHQNSIDPAATWIVQKYGGTSVGKFAEKIAGEIVPNYLDQHKIAIVCSARSGSTKALGTTNLLLRAASEALQRPSNSRSSTIGTPGIASPPLVPPTAHNKAFLPRKESVGGNTSFPSNHVNGNGSGSDPVQRARADTANSSTASPRSCSPFSPYASGFGGHNAVVGGGAMTPQSPIGGGGGGFGASYAVGAQVFQATVDVLKADHLKAARSSVKDPELLKELEGEIERDCEGLRSFLFAAQIIDEISPRSRDSIIGVGERLSCKLVAAVLRDKGVDSEFVSLENIVPSLSGDDGDVPSSTATTSQQQDGENGSLDQSFYDRVAAAVGERIRQCGSRVPVVTGFFGPVPGSLLRQIGRGYTDLLAALAAVGLGASELQIWKEVDGIFTADPRKVPTARLIPIISPDEAAELTYYGSEVVHPFTMEQVIRKRIPIRIKNVENPLGGGTVIHPDPDADLDDLDDGGPLSALSAGAGAGLGSPTSSSSLLDQEKMKKLPTAVTIKERITVLNVHSNRKSVSHGFFARIFSTLDKFGVVVDLISTSEVHVSMAIESDGLGKRTLDRVVRELQQSGVVSIHDDMAILSLVGKQMRNLVGIAGRMFMTLAEGDVNIEMISQGASEINISCVIDGRDAVKALNLIHQSCLQIRPEGAFGRMGPWLF